MPNIAEQIKCVIRELGMRQSVYPRRIAAGKMKQDDAKREIETMHAVLQTLRRVEADDEHRDTPAA
jgi:hypothetical protein